MRDPALIRQPSGRNGQPSLRQGRTASIPSCPRPRSGMSDPTPRAHQDPCSAHVSTILRPDHGVNQEEWIITGVILADTNYSWASLSWGYPAAISGRKPLSQNFSFPSLCLIARHPPGALSYTVPPDIVNSEFHHKLVGISYTLIKITLPSCLTRS